MRDIRNRLFQFIISLLKTAALCTKFPELHVDLFGKPAHIAVTGRKEDQGIRVILQLLDKLRVYFIGRPVKQNDFDKQYDDCDSKNCT